VKIIKRSLKRIKLAETQPHPLFAKAVAYARDKERSWGRARKPVSNPVPPPPKPPPPRMGEGGHGP